MRQGAQGWGTGMTLRGGVVREVGGGFRMGNTCTPVDDSCQCMTKTAAAAAAAAAKLLKSESAVAQSCLTSSDPMDCSLPDSSIHGVFKARILEWVAVAFSSKNHYNILK